MKQPQWHYDGDNENRINNDDVDGGLHSRPKPAGHQDGKAPLTGLSSSVSVPSNR